MVQKRETKAINKLCVREILSLSFVCGAYFFEFRGRNLVCFGIAYNFERMRTAFFTRVGLAIRRSRVRVPLWPLAGFVLGRTEFKFSAMLVNSQLVASFQLGFLVPLCYI